MTIFKWLYSSFICLSVYTSLIFNMVLSNEIGEISESHRTAYFEWKIENFFELPQEPDIKYESPVFLFSDGLWNLIIYPNGHRQSGSSGWIDVYVQMKRLGTSKTVNYTVGLKKADNTEEELCDGSKIFQEHSAWGRSKVIEKARISQVLASNRLVLTCTLKIDKPYSMKGVDTLSENLGDLLSRGQGHDVTFIVKDIKFRAHKVILGARSKAFSSLFFHNSTVRNDSTLYVNNCEPDAFRKFLRYVYTGRKQNVSISILEDFCYAAYRFDLPDLKQGCASVVKKRLNENSVTSILLLAAKYNDTDLLRSATDFLNESIENILLTPEWQIFLKENPVAANELYIKALKTCYAKN